MLDNENRASERLSSPVRETSVRLCFPVREPNEKDAYDHNGCTKADDVLLV